MQRKHTTDEGFDVVVTENGSTTRTTTVMKLAVAEYDYLHATYHPVSGINTELMLRVRDQIKASEAFWNQGVWREFITPQEAVSAERIDDAEDMQEALAFESLAPSCGTALCFAGWGAEVSRVDWVMDAEAILRYNSDNAEAILRYNSDHEYLPKDMGDLLVLVPKLWFEERIAHFDNLYVATWTMSDLPYWLHEHALRRGFSDATHRLLEVGRFSYLALGLDNDPYSLFDGDNSFEYVVAASTALASMDRDPVSYSSLELDYLLERAAQEQGVTLRDDDYVNGMPPEQYEQEYGTD